MKTTEKSIYDFPVYYDLIFGSDWAAEFRFLEGVFAKHVTGRSASSKGASKKAASKKVASKKEPPRQAMGCLKARSSVCLSQLVGPGRLLYRMVKAGYAIGGIDINEKAIAYCNSRLEKHGFAADTWVADMTDFTVAKPYDAAFNTINSFRHLSSDKQAVDHLNCMVKQFVPAESTRLDFTSLPPVVRQPIPRVGRLAEVIGREHRHVATRQGSEETGRAFQHSLRYSSADRIDANR